MSVPSQILLLEPYLKLRLFHCKRASGEIGRLSVHCSIARQSRDVIAAYHIVDQILGQFAQVSIRNKSGANDDMRRKFDTIKWTLKKIEQLVYDMSLQHGVKLDE